MELKNTFIRVIIRGALTYLFSSHEYIAVRPTVITADRADVIYNKGMTTDKILFL